MCIRDRGRISDESPVGKSLIGHKVGETVEVEAPIGLLKFVKEGSYTNYLFDKGIDKMLKKVGEESAEVIIAAKNPDKGELIYEISDLVYHTLVLMEQRDVTVAEIKKELTRRFHKE